MHNNPKAYPYVRRSDHMFGVVEIRSNGIGGQIMRPLPRGYPLSNSIEGIYEEFENESNDMKKQLKLLCYLHSL